VKWREIVRPVPFGERFEGLRVAFRDERVAAGVSVGSPTVPAVCTVLVVVSIVSPSPLARSSLTDHPLPNCSTPNPTTPTFFFFCFCFLLLLLLLLLRLLDKSPIRATSTVNEMSGAPRNLPAPPEQQVNRHLRQHLRRETFQMCGNTGSPHILPASISSDLATPHPRFVFLPATTKLRPPQATGGTSHPR